MFDVNQIQQTVGAYGWSRKKHQSLWCEIFKKHLILSCKKEPSPSHYSNCEEFTIHPVYNDWMDDFLDAIASSSTCQSVGQ